MNKTIQNKLLEIFEPELTHKILKCDIIDLPVGTRGFENENNCEEDTIPLVLEGRITVCQKDKFGNEVIIYNINPNQSCILSINSTFIKNVISLESYNSVKTKIALISKSKSKEWFDIYPSWRKFVMELYTKRLNELIKQHHTVSEQKVEIEGQNKKITDSITYAKRIQEAVFPSEHFITDAGWDYFIMFKPRDIVSGDFYWISEEGDNIIIAAADATGHGVPGAFMSMLGIAFLNELKETFENSDTEPNIFLDRLREKVKKSLNQTSKKDEAKDGMDIALTVINQKDRTVKYSGAHNPLYIIRTTNNEKLLLEIKPDRQPIGIHLKEKPFTSHTIPLQDNDVLYLFSDGYVDQFGGEKNIKFKAKRFKELLLSVCSKSMFEQKEILEKTFSDWKLHHEQLDDVLVMGIEV